MMYGSHDALYVSLLSFKKMGLRPIFIVLIGADL